MSVLKGIKDDGRYLWPLLLPVLFIALGASRFPFPGWGGAYSDITVTHYPNAYYLKEALLKGEIPLWSPTILSGYPFIANPLSGMWYPPGWLALLLPLPMGFNLVAALHVLWGGLGMYYLLRKEGLGKEACAFGALAYAMMPKWVGHYGAGHLSLVYAFSWTPWLLSAAWEDLKREAVAKQITPYPSAVLALTFLADVRWAAYAGLLWWVYRLAHSHNLGWSLKSLFLQSSLAFICAAPLALPLLEYTRLSTRSALTSEDLFAFSLPVERVLGLIYPDFQGSPEWVLYPGAFLLCLGLYGILISGWKSRFWFLIGLVGVLLALGILNPIAQILLRIPGIAWLRIPSRSLFLTDFALVMLSAFALEQLLRAPMLARTRVVQKVWVALGEFAVLLAIGSWIFAGQISLEYAWGAVALVLASAWLMLGLNGWPRLSQRLWYGGLIGLCLVDLGMIDRSLLTFRPAQEVFQEGELAAQWLAHQPGLFRVYSPSYSIPQHTAVRWGLQLADGVDPLQLKSYATFMQDASGVPAPGYSVTLPPLEGDNPSQANASFIPDPALLGLLNVRYLASEFDIQVEGLVLRERVGRTRIYENLLALPRAWIQAAGLTPGEEIRPVRSMSWSPQRIALEADGPGLLILSEVMYPGWQVWVDGYQASIKTVTGLLRGVILEAGRHQVVFVFRPRTVFLGIGLGLIGWLGVCLLAFRPKIRYAGL